ncbi:MAG: carbon storage regulator CsrA [Planctomycetes bacterium]|nr:carbon storage regulator CsrA [Planctomycetota bacterium]
MLVLTRGKDEAIIIGDGIEVTVLEIKGDKVKIGIAAPASVPVHRKEVWLALRDANVAAADAKDVAAAAELFKKKGLGGAGSEKK